jgi:arabinogalactan endo-1,4-beta-galactosidase
MKWAFFLVPAYIFLSTPAAVSGPYFGGDLSFANEMSDCGATYRDNGVVKDVYTIFRDHGANLIRIRIWTDGNQTKYSNFGDVEKSIRRAKAAGMKVLLDFHYSDSWADGDKQIIPAAWAGITDNATLAQTLYKYTYDTLTTLDRDGLMPEMVQVGNEINREMLGRVDWEKSRPIDWERNAMIVNAGIKAVRDAGGNSKIKPKVILHIAQPENVEAWFAAATKAGITDYDVIGISYYGKWSKYSVANLGTEIFRLTHLYKAEVMVVETGYVWTLAWNDTTPNTLGEDSIIRGYPATREGQKKFLMDVTQAVLANGGVGVLYWAPDWVSTDRTTQWGRRSSWENATLFDFDNEVLPGIDFMQQAGKPPG